MSTVRNSINQASPLVKFAAAVIIIAGLKVAGSVLLPLMLALFISIICAQPIFWLVKRKVPSWLAMVIVLSGLITTVVLLASLIRSSLSGFTANLPVYAARLDVILDSIGQQTRLLEEGTSLDQMIDNLDTDKLLKFTSNIVSQLGALLSNSFIILLITVFILGEVKLTYLKADLLEREFGQSLLYLDEVASKLRQYLSLKTVISLITGVFIAVCLQIIGVKYAILWGVIAFLLNYIPTIGSIIAAVPTMALALVELGFGGFLWTGVAYLVANVLMGSIIEPRLMGKGLGLSTLVVFISLIFWGYIFGPVGMFLSIPITISIKVMLARNERTRWISWLLASRQDVERMLDEGPSGPEDVS